MRKRENAWYGYRPDLPDKRDHIFDEGAYRVASVPTKVTLQNLPPVYDQGQLGSCTANAIAAAVEYETRIQQLPDFMPSRLFIYYNERVIEGTVGSDAGAEIRDGIKSINQVGCAHESIWPYVISKFKTKPTKKVYTDAKLHLALAYSRITTLAQMKACLAQGFPFVFGFTVYDSFESDQVAQTGVVNLPQPDEQVVGGHAVLAVGYDNASGRFTVRNSWGADWGQAGYFTMPYAYLEDRNLSDDFWKVTRVE